MFASLKCIFKRMKTLKTKSHCAQESWWSGTLGFYWCLHSSLTPTRLWNVYRQWAGKKTVIILLGFSVRKSTLALCVPNHINYLSGCCNPPLGICCISLQVPRQGCSQSVAVGPGVLSVDVQHVEALVELYSNDILSVSSFACLFWGGTNQL